MVVTRHVTAATPWAGCAVIVVSGAATSVVSGARAQDATGRPTSTDTDISSPVGSATAREGKGGLISWPKPSSTL